MRVQNVIRHTHGGYARPAPTARYSPGRPGALTAESSTWPPGSTHSDVPARPKAYDETHAACTKTRHAPGSARAVPSGLLRQLQHVGQTQKPLTQTPSRPISSLQPVEVFPSYDFPIGLRPVPTVSPRDYVISIPKREASRRSFGVFGTKNQLKRRKTTLPREQQSVLETRMR